MERPLSYSNASTGVVINKDCQRVFEGLVTQRGNRKTESNINTGE
jgi:hypothetical protein